MKDLAMGIMMGNSEVDVVSSLAGRLARLNNQLDQQEQQRIRNAADGIGLTEIISGLFSAIDGDNIETRALQLAGQTIGSNPGNDMRDKARAELVSETATVFNGELIELIDSIRREREQKIDHENLDEVIKAEWESDSTDKAQQLTKDFEQYLNDNKDQILALEIFFNQPHRRRELTFEHISEVMQQLKADQPRLAPLHVWQAFAQLQNYQGKQPINELTALVALIRHVCGIDKKLSTYDSTVRKNFQNWIMKHHAGSSIKFNQEQMQWLHMIRDHVINSFHFEQDDCEMAPFDAQGGLGKMYQLFGANMEGLIEELNKELVA